MRSFFLFTISFYAFALLSADANAQLLTGYGEDLSLDELQPEPLMRPSPRPLNPVEVQPMQTTQLREYQPFMTYGNSPVGQPPQVEEQDRGEPVDLDADNLSYDEGSEVVTASGNVFLRQKGRILRADKMRYNVGQDEVIASGHVVLNEANGDVHVVDHAQYQSALKNGKVENLRTTLNDGSRFTADSGVHESGVKTTMHDAHYTPCIPCGDDPDATPDWALRSSEVTHNKEEHRISYKNARFELWGVPVAYMPYFSHPDGSIKQKSGFLSPSFGYKSELGAFVEESYYWAIGPDQDATLGVMAMTDQAPLGLIEYRKRWNNASLEIDGGITSSDRSDRTTGIVVKEDDELRGHVSANARWDMNDKWRSGLDVNYTSDDQYMRQYDFTNEDVLESQLYAERFSGRDYFSGRLISYQDIRVRDEVGGLDQPDVLPEMIASFKGEPGAVPIIKGRWSADVSMLGLRREGDEQDVNRFSGDLGWKRRFVSDYGLLTSAEGHLHGDIYHTNDRTNALGGGGRSKSGTELRAFPQVHIETAYPMARPFETMQATIEPVVSLTVASRIDQDDDSNIPNEDSNDVQIDASNLFEPNRFPGLDRIEDQSRATYGLRTGLHGNDGSFAEAFVGQSYRFDDQNNPFPIGSGLNAQESDVVGQVTGRYKDIYSLDYRYQLSSRHLTSQRHEVNAYADWNRFRLDTRYLFAKALEGTELDQSREQIDADAQFYMTPNWRVRSGAVYDFGENNDLRQAYTGLDYLGQCLSLSLTGEKNFTTEASGESGTEILFRVGLKNMGQFEESGYRYKNGESACAMF